MIVKLNVSEVYRAFKIHPSQIYHLTYRGTLPKRPRGVITLEWLEALADWHKKVRGKLPPEAMEIIIQVDSEKFK